MTLLETSTNHIKPPLRQQSFSALWLSVWISLQ